MERNEQRSVLPLPQNKQRSSTRSKKNEKELGPRTGVRRLDLLLPCLPLPLMTSNIATSKGINTTAHSLSSPATEPPFLPPKALAMRHDPTSARTHQSHAQPLASRNEARTHTLTALVLSIPATPHLTILTRSLGPHVPTATPPPRETPLESITARQSSTVSEMRVSMGGREGMIAAPRMGEWSAQEGPVTARGRQWRRERAEGARNAL